MKAPRKAPDYISKASHFCRILLDPCALEAEKRQAGVYILDMAARLDRAIRRKITHPRRVGCEQ